MIICTSSNLWGWGGRRRRRWELRGRGRGELLWLHIERNQYNFDRGSWSLHRRHTSSLTPLPESDPNQQPEASAYINRGAVRNHQSLNQAVHIMKNQKLLLYSATLMPILCSFSHGFSYSKRKLQQLLGSSLQYTVNTDSTDVGTTSSLAQSKPQWVRKSLKVYY